MKNKKISSFFCNPKTALKNVAILLLMVFLVVYAGFQILPSFSEELEIETAYYVTMYDANETTGYIFRDETPVKSTHNGVIMTFVKDSERVSKGQHFANIYTTEDFAELKAEIDKIDDKIAVLKKSAIEKNTYVTDISKTDNEINNDLDKIYKMSSASDLYEMSDIADELLIGLNKKGLIVNSSDDYQEQLYTLVLKRADLESRINAVSTRVVAESSGYYYGDTDGYESVFRPELLENINHESFDVIKNTLPQSDSQISSYGKIVNDFVWYIVCESDKNAAAKYAENRYYKLLFHDSGEDEITMKLEKIVKNTTKETTLLVFRGNTSPQDFDYKRCQQVDIITDSYSGFAVPKEAVRIVDNIKGVYILDGDIVRFRRIEIIQEDKEYYIVKKPENVRLEHLEATASNNGEAKYKYLSLYDSVIVNGKNLFDGKIVA